jgi:nicotinamidase-related amidase
MVKRYAAHSAELRGRSALVIVNMQEFHGDLARGIAANVAELAAAARLGDAPVVFTRSGHYVGEADDQAAHWWRQATPEVATAPWQIIDELTVADDDTVIDTERFSAFAGTALAELLADADVGSVIICGATTDGAVASTARDAFDRGFAVVVIADAVAAADDVMQGAALISLAHSCAGVTWTDELVAAITAVSQEDE